MVRVGVLTRRCFEFAQGQEISEGGLMVQTKIPLEVGERVEIHLLIPGESYFSVFGYVIYLLPPRHGEPDECRAGIAFTNLMGENQMMIRTFVANQKSGS